MIFRKYFVQPHFSTEDFFFFFLSDKYTILCVQWKLKVLLGAEELVPPSCSAIPVHRVNNSVKQSAPRWHWD